MKHIENQGNRPNSKHTRNHITLRPSEHVYLATNSISKHTQNRNIKGKAPDNCTARARNFTTLPPIVNTASRQRNIDLASYFRSLSPITAEGTFFSKPYTFLSRQDCILCQKIGLSKENVLKDTKYSQQ